MCIYIYIYIYVYIYIYIYFFWPFVTKSNPYLCKPYPLPSSSAPNLPTNLIPTNIA